MLATIPGMQNTCFSYREANAHRIEGAEPLRLLAQDLPTRDV